MNVTMDSPKVVLFKDLGRVSCWLKRKIKVAGTWGDRGERWNSYSEETLYRTKYILRSKTSKSTCT